MLISFIFSYSENFFVVFYLSFYFVLGQGPSARDIWIHRSTDLCDLLEEYRDTTDYYADEELNTGGTKRCKKNKRQRKKERTKRCERALWLTEVGIPEEVKPDGLHNQKKDEFGRSNLQASEDFMSKVKEHDERVWNILHKYQEVF